MSTKKRSTKSYQKSEDEIAALRKHMSKQLQLIRTIRIEDPENICTNNIQETQIKQSIQKNARSEN